MPPEGMVSSTRCLIRVLRLRGVFLRAMRVGISFCWLSLGSPQRVAEELPSFSIIREFASFFAEFL